MWRCTRYVALHPIRTGALPTDRVHCLRIGCTAHANKPKRGHAHLPRSRQCTIHHCDALLGQTLRYLLASATPPSSATLPLTNPTAARVATTQGTTSTTGHCTRYVALHPLCGAAPLTWRCTRSERVHCLRIGCIAYGSGAAPTFTSPNADTHTSTRTGHAPPTTATHYLDRHCATYSPAQRPPSSATLPLTSLTAARVATTHQAVTAPLQGTAPLTWRCTRSERVHCLRIGCTAHTHKPNRGEHPAARSLRPATVRTFTNSARNSLTATRNNTPETAGFQRSDFKS